MRPPSIFVPGGIPKSASRFLQRQGAPLPAPAVARKRFLSSDNKELKTPAIQGFACLYGKAFFASERYRVMKSGAFIDTIHNRNPKRVLFNHDPSQELASTADGLEFANCLDGLAFRLPLSSAPRGWDIYDAVRSNQMPCVSVGASVVEKTVRKTSDGIEYDYIAKADLREISLCYEGAVSGTFATIVDLDDENPYLWLACRAPRFATDKAVANATASLQRISDALNSLRA